MSAANQILSGSIRGSNLVVLLFPDVVLGLEVTLFVALLVVVLGVDLGGSIPSGLVLLGVACPSSFLVSAPSHPVYRLVSWAATNCGFKNKSWVVSILSNSPK
jgi:hypothetical protein